MTTQRLAKGRHDHRIRLRYRPDTAAASAAEGADLVIEQVQSTPSERTAKPDEIAPWPSSWASADSEDCTGSIFNHGPRLTRKLGQEAWRSILPAVDSQWKVRTR